MAALTESQLDDLEIRLRSLGITGLRPLPGGASSMIFAGLLGQRRVVVKVAPPGVAPTLNRDVLHWCGDRAVVSCAGDGRSGLGAGLADRRLGVAEIRARGASAQHRAR